MFSLLRTVTHKVEDITRTCTLRTVPVFVQRTVKDFNFRNDCCILVLTPAKLVNC